MAALYEGVHELAGVEKPTLSHWERAAPFNSFTAPMSAGFLKYRAVIDRRYSMNCGPETFFSNLLARTHWMKLDFSKLDKQRAMCSFEIRKVLGFESQLD